MPAAQLSAAQLHEPILPLARPPQVVLTPEPEHKIWEVMVDNVVAIPDWATVLIASEYFATRRLLAFPVVDAKGVLLGVVDVPLFTDEVIDLARRTYDDISQLIGVHGTAQRSTIDAFKDRFPWLSCNIAGGLVAAFIASRFEHLLQNVVVLALFIPVVLALAESVSMQALSLTLQSFTDGPFVAKRLAAAQWKKFRTAVLLGLGCGGVVATVVVLWRGEAMVAGVIFAAIALSIIVACLLGVAFPAVLRVAKADPRIAAGPVVLAAADVATLFFYFGLGSRFLG